MVQRTALGSFIHLRRQYLKQSVADLATSSGVSEATIRRIERAAPGTEFRPTVATLAKLEQSLDSRRGFVFELLEQDQGSDVPPVDISTFQNVADSLGSFIDGMLKAAGKKDLADYTRSTARDVADSLSELYVTVLMESAAAGAPWAPVEDDLYRTIGPTMTAPEPDSGTAAHRRWAYRRWLRGDFDGGEYSEDFRRRLAAVTDGEADPIGQLDSVRSAAAAQGIDSLAGVPVSTLAAVAQRDGSCGQVYDALRHIFLGRPLDDPTPLQQALIDDNAAFDGLTAEQTTLLAEWTQHGR